MGVLDGKTILMIGAGTIAKGSSAELTKAGANLVIGDPFIESAQAIADGAAIGSGKIKAIVADLASEESLKAAVASTVDAFGRIDGLYLNGADTIGAREDYDLLAVDPAIWHRALQVNLTGYFFGIRAALPVMIEQGRGSIVCMASDDAFLGAPTRIAYSVSKIGVLALIRHVASRWGKAGIRANALAPGLIPNPDIVGDVLGVDIQKFYDDFLEQTPSWRLGKPSDIGAAARFLFSDEGEWVNGQVWCVDGGLVMR